MTRVFIINPQPFYLEIVDELARRGIDPVLTCGNRFKSINEQLTDRASVSAPLSAHEMYAAKTPDQIAGADLTMSTSELAVLAPHEGTILEMMDRLNYDCWPISELRSLSHRYFAIWRELLRKFQPTAVVFHGTPHMGHDFVLYVQCEHAGIRTLIFEPTYVHERMYMRHTLAEFVGTPASSTPTYASSSNTVKHEKLPDKRPASHYQQLNQLFNDVDSIKGDLSLLSIFKTLLGAIRPRNFFRRASAEQYEISKNHPLMAIHRLRELRVKRDVRRCLSFYERHTHSPSEKEKYLYFPLHYQPERTTLPDGGFFSDQLLVVRNLLVGLPDDWLLYVREHPRQFRRGALWTKSRSIRYYQALASDPRVRFVPLSQPSDQLISKASAVATINGTSAWEAVQMGKPALIWGNPWYGNCPGVFQVKGTDDCTALLGRIDRGELAVPRHAVEEYRLRVSSEWGFPGCFLHGFLGNSSMNAEQNAKHYVDSIQIGINHPRNDSRTADCRIPDVATVV